MSATLRLHLNAPLGDPLPRRLLERALRETFRREGCDEAELSVTFLHDDEIAAMAERYLGHSGPADVLSFPLHDEGDPPLGDVYVGIEQAGRQAAEAGVPLDEELVRLAVHGALHVLGYDHPAAAEDRASSEQFRRQEAIVAWALQEPSARGRGRVRS